MSIFLSETASSGASLIGKTADVGGAWATQATQYGTNDPVVSGGVINPGINWCWDYNPATPGGTDYNVIAEFTPTASTWIAGALAYCGAQCYAVVATYSGAIKIVRVDATNPWDTNTIGATTHAIAAADRASHTIKLIVSRSGSINTLSAELDGVVVNFGSTLTDSNLSSGPAGWCGRDSTTSYITATDAVAAGGTFTARPYYDMLIGGASV